MLRALCCIADALTCLQHSCGDCGVLVQLNFARSFDNLLPCFSTRDSYKSEFDEAGKHNELLAANLSKVVDDLHPVRVLQLFSAIPEEVRAGWDSPIGRTAWV